MSATITAKSASSSKMQTVNEKLMKTAENEAMQRTSKTDMFDSNINDRSDMQEEVK